MLGMRLLGLALAACITGGCAHAPRTSPAAEGRAPSLVGRPWDVAASAYTTPEHVFERAAAARFVLLGEKHDNPEHHRLQAAVLRSMAEAGRRPAVLFEMLDTTQQAKVDRYRARPGGASGLGDAVGWQASGWPPFATYQPIVEVALTYQLPIVAANLPPSDVHAVAERGLSALDTATATRLGLDRPLPPGLEQPLEQELAEAHCGMLPVAMLPTMALAQRARDAAMAERLAATDLSGGGVLVTGGEHARRDRGVPLSLARLRPERSVVSIAFVEAIDGQGDPRAYAASFAASRLPFDFVWFTPRVSEEDPCAAMKRARP
jgi:uncharacterized iron-regulated protein